MVLLTLDLALRSGTTGFLVLLAALLLRDFGRVAAGRLGSAFALGSGAYAISSAAGFAADLNWWRALLIALSTGNVIVFWLFTRALFDDRFTARKWHAAAWAALVGISLLNCLILVPAHAWGARLAGPGLSIVALGCMLLAVGQSIASWSADLVEGRRQLRVFVVASAAVFGGVNAGLQLVWFGNEPPLLVSVTNATILAGIVAAVTWSMTRVAGEQVFPITAELQPAGGISAPDPADQRLVEALNLLMANERVYRHEGVTIGALALKLGVPEYRLRRLINQKLGYRNFNVFLNNHRIEEVKAALADPAQAEVPVTTIALDAGFQSLGPFNRAFKAVTGVTPSEYRRVHLAAA